MKKNVNNILWGAMLLGAVVYVPMAFSSTLSDIRQATIDTAKGQLMSSGAGVVKDLAQKGITNVSSTFAGNAANAANSAASSAGSFSLSDLNPFKGCSIGLGSVTGGGSPYHTGVLGYTFDVGSAGSRVLSTAVKYFLSDDTDLIAELVWKKGNETGGCGRCYGGDPKTGADLEFSAVFDDISEESDVYRDGESVATECVPNLAQKRLSLCVVDSSSLAELDQAIWRTRRLAQRRSIQALTDALNMKRLYKSIKDKATSIKDNYNDYSAAVSTVASKRLLLDQLLALKKRVVAARVRARAQTLELGGVDLRKVTTAPNLTLICSEK